MASEFTKEDLNRIKQDLKDEEIKPYQFYNTLLEPVDFTLQQFKKELNFKPGVAPIVNTTVYDIEVTEGDLHNVFPDPKEAEFPVDTIVLYNNITNTVYCLVRLLPSHLRKYKSDKENMTFIITDYIRKEYTRLCKENKGYIIPDIKFETQCFHDDYDLVKRFWELNKELNTLVLVGFNSIGFDDIYMFVRSKKLFSRGLGKIMSKYGEFQSYNPTDFTIPDYTLMDLLRLYKPVDAGGLGFGKSQRSYKLDYLGNKILGINKLDIPGGFYENYSTNLLDFVLYNVLDVILTYKLNDYLNFIEIVRSMSTNACTFETMITGKSRAFKQEEITEGDLVYRSYLFNKEIQK
jgi:DNA polymerase elongation subunit (family B)